MEMKGQRPAYKKVLLDIPSSLEWIDVVTTVVDKVSKENQLLPLPTGLASSLVEAWSGGTSKWHN